MPQHVNMKPLLRPLQTLIQSNILSFKESTNATNTVLPYPHFATLYREPLNIFNSTHLSSVPGHRRLSTKLQHSFVLLVFPKLTLSSLGTKNRNPNKTYRLRLRQIIPPSCLSTSLPHPDIIAALQLHQRKDAVATDIMITPQMK